MAKGEFEIILVLILSTNSVLLRRMPLMVFGTPLLAVQALQREKERVLTLPKSTFSVHSSMVHPAPLDKI